jgi:hemerythrin-like domain-containing protein
MKPKPIKRHPALIPVSQDHHFGLLLVWKIRKGIDKEIETERIKKYLNYFMGEHLEAHFQMEENVLFSYLAKNDLLRKQAEQQHQQLRQKQQEIVTHENVPVDLLSDFADELESHIRFEERKLFQHMQKELSENVLEELEIAIKKIHEKVVEDWQDEFWVR